MSGLIKLTACVSMVLIVACGSVDNGGGMLPVGGTGGVTSGSTGGSTSGGNTQGGGQGGNQGGNGGAGGMGICFEPGAACTENLDCCGYQPAGATAICLSDDGACHATCTTGSQCNSGCCISTTVNGQASYGACASADHCGPVCHSQPGQACTQNGDCCGYSANGGAKAICLSQDGVCHATCTSGAQCNSGCCVATTINGQASYGACAAAVNCQ